MGEVFSTLLLENGRFLDDGFQRERVTCSEVMAAIRGKEIAGVESVAAVVLETDGSFSVIGDAGSPTGSALADVRCGPG